MIEATQNFVCAADEVWRLQRGSQADCVFFQRMVTGGERITDRGSRQGTWICAPGGVVLARFNTRDVDKVLETLERGLAAWRELPDEQRRLPADAELEPEHRWEHSYPEGGLALVRFARGTHTLVHEAAFVPTPVQALELGIAEDPERLRREAALHTSLEAVGRVAMRVGAKILVLVRLRPPPVYDLQITSIVDDHFEGRILIACDGDEITP